MPPVPNSADLIEAICTAMSVDSRHVQRVVLDVAYGDVAHVYMQMVGDKHLLEIDWPGHLKNADVYFDARQPKL